MYKEISIEQFRRLDFSKRRRLSGYTRKELSKLYGGNVGCFNYWEKTFDARSEFFSQMIVLSKYLDVTIRDYGKPIPINSEATECLNWYVYHKEISRKSPTKISHGTQKKFFNNLMNGKVPTMFLRMLDKLSAYGIDIVFNFEPFEDEDGKRIGEFYVEFLNHIISLETDYSSEKLALSIGIDYDILRRILINERVRTNDIYKVVKYLNKVK